MDGHRPAIKIIIGTVEGGELYLQAPGGSAAQVDECRAGVRALGVIFWHPHQGSVSAKGQIVTEPVVRGGHGGGELLLNDPGSATSRKDIGRARVCGAFDAVVGYVAHQGGICVNGHRVAQGLVGLTHHGGELGLLLPCLVRAQGRAGCAGHIQRPGLLAAQPKQPRHQGEHSRLISVQCQTHKLLPIGVPAASSAGFLMIFVRGDDSTPKGPASHLSSGTFGCLTRNFPSAPGRRGRLTHSRTGCQEMGSNPLPGGGGPPRNVARRTPPGGRGQRKSWWVSCFIPERSEGTRRQRTVTGPAAAHLH